MTRRRLSWTFLGIAIGVTLLVWTFWHVDFRALLARLAGADLSLVAVVAVLNFVVIALKAWRWQVVIGATQTVPYRQVGLSTLVGFMANNVLPARAGELVRVILLGRRSRVSKATLLASVGIDKLVEGASLVAVVALVPLVTTLPDKLRVWAWILSAVLAALFALAVYASSSSDHGWLDKLPLSARVRAAIARTFDRLASGFAAIRSPAHLAGSLAIAVLTWSVSALMIWVCLRSMHIHVSFLDACITLIAVNLAVMVPGAPGSVGTFEAGIVWVLSIFKVGNVEAAAFALVYHGVQLIPTVVVGLLALPAAGIRWRDLEESEARPLPVAPVALEPVDHCQS